MSVNTKYVDPEELGRIVTALAQRGYTSVPNAAKLLSVHPNTLREWIDKGYVRAIQVGCRKCITFDEIERYKTEGNYDPVKYGIEPTH